MNLDSLNALDQLSESILQSLYRASWQGGLAALLVWSLCSIFPRLPATARSWLWRLVFVKMILAFIWTHPVELALLPAPKTVATETSAFPPQNEPAVTTESHRSAGFPAGESAPILLSTSQTTPLSPSLSPRGLETQHESIAVEVEPILQPIEPILATSNSSLSAYWKLLLTASWSFGVLLSLTLLAQQFRRARTLRRNSTRCTDADRILHPSIALARAIGLIRLPEIRISPTATRPMLIGLLHPTLILPEQLLATASAESLRMMIAHELAHIRRGDLAWTTLAALIRTIFFFHPLVWLARRESLLAQEIACDELALRITSSPATRYAKMLVDVVALPASPAPALISLGVAETRKTLERRIRHMKFIGHKKTKLVQLITAVALLTALIALIPFQLVAAEPETVENSVPRDSTVPQVKPSLREEFPRESRQVDSAELQRLQDEGLNQDPKALAATQGNEIGQLRAPTSLQSADEFQRQQDAALATYLKSIREGRDEYARLYEELRDRDGAELRQILPTVTGDPLLIAHLKALAEAQQKYAALQNDYSDEHPEIVKIRNVMKLINGQIDDRVEGLLAGLQVKAEASAKLERDLQSHREAQSERNLQSRREFLEKTISLRRSELEKLKQLLGNDVDFTANYFQLKRELENSERQLAQLNEGQPAQSTLAPAEAVESKPPAPARTVSVHARTGGIVQSVLVKTGDTVKKGDRLLFLDKPAAQRRVAAAEARAKIAEADLEIARSEFVKTGKEHEIFSKKVQVGKAGPEEEPNVEKASANVRKAEAQLELAKLDVNEAAENLNNQILRAPVDGVVTFIIHEGYWVPEGGGKILAHIQTAANKKQAAAQALQRLKDELAKLKEQEAELLTKYRPKYPGVQNIQKQIAALEDRIRAEQNDSRVQEIFVNGQVNNPGAISLPPDQELDILGAIARAGGFTQRANQNKIKFSRPREPERVFSFDDLKNPKNRIPLLPGDIIQVTDKVF